MILTILVACVVGNVNRQGFLEYSILHNINYRTLCNIAYFKIIGTICCLYRFMGMYAIYTTAIHYILDLFKSRAFHICAILYHGLNILKYANYEPVKSGDRFCI